MGVEPSGGLRAAARTWPSRALAWSLVLGLLCVIVAAGVGSTHFGGPRWLPRSHAPRLHPPNAVPGGVRRPVHTPGFPAWIMWVIAGIAAAVLLLVAAKLLYGLLPARRRRGRAARAPAIAIPTAGRADAQEPDPPAVRSGIELALALLGEDREPADAVVRAWLGLQESAERSGVGRRAAETPTEFTTRIVRRVVADDRPVQTLLRLYLRTRFGDHPVTDDDVVVVREALRELVAAWPAPRTPASLRSARTPAAPRSPSR